MRRKYYFISLAAMALLLIGNIVASAQSLPLGGHVVMTGADGAQTPVVGATVDVFRVDVPGKFETKTDKKGRFTFAGLPITGSYIISVSAPSAQPAVLSNIQPSAEQDYEVKMVAGDGRRLSMDEAKAVGGRTPTATPGAAPVESAADRAKREELARQNAAIEAENKKNVDINAVLNRTFKAGQDALTAKQWDTAIAQFKEGLAADPNQDALYVGLAEAYRLRGAERFNAAVREKDETARNAGIKAAQQDWRDAAEASGKAAEIAKNKPAQTDPALQAQQARNKLAAFDVRFKTMILFVSKVDGSQADAGLVAFNDYYAAETDAAKKAKAQLDAAKMLLDAGAADKAYDQYVKILESNPDNVDALIGAGLALYNIAYQTNDKAKFQEAANYLQRFVDKAPDTNPLKADAKAVLEEVKNQQNIRPERGTPTRRRGR